jgi:hypothetical protein
MSNRTTAYVLGGVTILAWIVFWNGLLRAWAVTHESSRYADATLKLVG